MHDPIAGRPRFDWNPGTDDDPGRPEPDAARETTNFHFDLGGALARLGGGERSSAPAEPPAPPAPSAPAGPSALPEPSAFDAPPVVAPSGFDAPPAVGPALDAPPSVAIPGAGASVGTEPALAPGPMPAPPAPATEPHAGVSTTTVPPPPSFADQLPQRAPGLAPEPDNYEPLPRRGERAPEPVAAAESIATAREMSPSPSSYLTSRRSVFDDVAAAQPVIGATNGMAPTLAAAPTMAQTTATLTPILPSANPVAQAAGAPVLPTLPAPAPVTVPLHTPPVAPAAGTTDLTALRAAQMRAKRQQRKGKLFGRTLLALLVIGGVVAAALVFGRSYLFPTEWDAALTPMVDDIQTERGIEFDHAVELVRQEPTEYGLTATTLTIGDAWLDDVPAWRALGIASGEPTLDAVAPQVAATRQAIFDADADQIITASGSTPSATDLRVALDQAFDAQHGDIESVADDTARLMGVSARGDIAALAVQTHVAVRQLGSTTVDGAAQTAAGDAATANAAPLPLPLEYELRAPGVLGEALLAAAGLDPASVTPAAGRAAAVAAALDDGATATASSALQPGDRALDPPVALGVDDWSLVWGARLPASTVGQLASAVTADSYRQVDRAGVICVIGVFQTANAADAAYVLSAMQTWAAAAPVASAATAAPLDETRVELRACDPGADAATVPNAGAVDALLDRQLERLAG